jgi:D-alanine-D-alanine ligase-like ATP-grasp enzyme
MASLPMVSFAHDPAGAYTYRSQVVWEEAQRRGIPMEQMTIFGSPTEIYRARLGDSWKYFQSLPITTPSDTNPVEMDDKFLLKQKLRAAGIPAPRAVSVTKLADAYEAQAQWQTPLAIKPRVGSRGRHTTVNVRTPEEMSVAFKSAQKLCKYVVVEEYLEGSVCRGTVVGGMLAGFFQAHPPEVTGDGRSTIVELVAAQNAAKPERVQDISLTDESLAFLERGGYSPETILPSGVTIPLTHRTGRLFGGRTRELLGHEHKKLREYLERAAALLKTPIVGFDLIIPDPEADPDTQKWGIIEANSLPYIDLHYLPLTGTPSNVAARVWDYVEAGDR